MPRQVSLADAGPLREWTPGTVMVMSAATAHSRPHQPDPEPHLPRWFCRASLRVAVTPPNDDVDVTVDGEGINGAAVHKGDPKAELRAARLAVGVLVAEHVWGDPEFAAAARAYADGR